MCYKMISLSSMKYIDGILNIINLYNNVHDNKVEYDIKRIIKKYHVHYNLELKGDIKAVSYVLIEISYLTNYNY